MITRSYSTSRVRVNYLILLCSTSEQIEDSQRIETLQSCSLFKIYVSSLKGILTLNVANLRTRTQSIRELLVILINLLLSFASIRA